MPVRKDAETAPQDTAGPAVGTIDPVDLQNALVDTQQFVLEQQKAIEARDEQLAILMERLDKMETRTERIEDGAPPPQKITPPSLPKGTKRYRSTFSEADYVKEGNHKVLVDGLPITRPEVVARFTGGVYQTADPEMIAWLDSHPENGTGFVEDSTAIRNHHDVEVIGGARHAEMTARNPLEAVLPE